MPQTIKTIAIVVVIIAIVVCSILYSTKQNYAFLPSDYGLSPMNRGVGFVKPFSINVDVPSSLNAQQANELVNSSRQQVLSQESPDLQMVTLSEDQLVALNAEIQPQVDAKKNEIEMLLAWWKGYMDVIPEKIQADIYSLSGLLQSPMSIQHFGLSQDHINILTELKRDLANIPPSMIRNHNDVIKYIAPALIKYQNGKLDNIYTGQYSNYDWANVV